MSMHFHFVIGIFIPAVLNCAAAWRLNRPVTATMSQLHSNTDPQHLLVLRGNRDKGPNEELSRRK